MADEQTDNPSPDAPAVRMSRLALLSAACGAFPFAYLALFDSLYGLRMYMALLEWLCLAPLAAIVLAFIAMRRVPRRTTPLALTRWNWPALMGLVLGFFTLPLTLVDDHTPAQARSISCRSNLRQVGIAIGMYRSDYGGELPPDMKTFLDRGYLKRTWCFYCPSSSAAQPDYESSSSDLWSTESSYLYVRPINREGEVMPTLPIMWERKLWHGPYGVSVLYSDLHVEGVQPDKLKKEIAANAAWYPAPPPLPQ